MRSSVIALLVAITQGFAPLAFAQSDKSDARGLLLTMRYDEQFNLFVSKCQSNAQSLSAEEILKANPNAFHGITPRSRYWPDVVRILNEHYEECCNSYSAEQFLDVFASEYSKHLTPTEIRSVTAFFSSPIGQKFVSANVAANSAFEADASAKLSKRTRELYPRLIKKLAELGNQYAKDPR